MRYPSYFSSYTQPGWWNDWRTSVASMGCARNGILATLPRATRFIRERWGANGPPLDADQPRCSRNPSGDGALAESSHGIFLVVVHLENSNEFCHLEQVADARREMGQFDADRSVTRGSVQTHERSKPARIDVMNATQVKDDGMSFGNQLLDGVAKLGRFIAENNAAVAVQNHYIFDQTRTHSQLHRVPSRPVELAGAETAYP